MASALAPENPVPDPENERYLADLAVEYAKSRAKVADLGGAFERIDRHIKESIEKYGLSEDVVFGSAMYLHPGFLKELVEAILQLTLINMQLHRQFWTFPRLSKRGSFRFDLVITADGKLVVVMEMENNPSRATLERALDYLAAIRMTETFRQMAEKLAPGEKMEQHVLFLVNGAKRSKTPAIRTYRMICSETGEEEEIFRATFVNINGDLSQIPNQKVREILRNFVHQDDSDAGRLVKKVLDETMNSEEYKMRSFALGTIYEEELAAKDAQLAAERAKTAALTAQVTSLLQQLNTPEYKDSAVAAKVKRVLAESQDAAIKPA